MDYIPIDRCKDGYLYIIDARNAFIGIYTEKEKAFTISRTKFTSNFLFNEFHWDTGSPYGTVYPLKEIEQVPEFNTDKEKIDWLNLKAKELRDQSLGIQWDTNENIRRLYKDKDTYLEKYK